MRPTNDHYLTDGLTEFHPIRAIPAATPAPENILSSALTFSICAL